MQIQQHLTFLFQVILEKFFGVIFVIAGAAALFIGYQYLSNQQAKRKGLIRLALSPKGVFTKAYNVKEDVILKLG